MCECYCEFGFHTLFTQPPGQNRVQILSIQISDTPCIGQNEFKRCYHVGVEDSTDLDQRLAFILTLVGRVDVFNYFTKVVRHALKLSVKGLGQGVNALALCIWGLRSYKGLFERAQNFFKLRLLAGDKIQFVFQALKSRKCT